LSIGKVLLFKNAGDGKLKEKLAVNSMQVFGVWNSILGNNARLDTARALEKSSALIIPKSTLDKKWQLLILFTDCFVGKNLLVTKILRHK
tara:strand:+ start:35 stop:304 length:270 start_codon:yes stop_codon:yes gene_type:complete